MALIESIESAIIGINSATFQKLGDALLLGHYPNAQMFVPQGSQFGKDKTIAGTPDTYIETERKCIFVEYSTNVSDKINKLIRDINKCAVEFSTYKTTKEPWIFLITNFKLSLKGQRKLREYSKSKGFYCKIMDGPLIAQELFSNHTELIPPFLGLSIDTGQIVDKKSFIKEYSNGIGDFACPLDNEFMFRNQEMSELLALINAKDFIVITGEPGVGKTKIALEAGERFCKLDPEYFFKCVSYKSESLLSDLTTNILPRQKTILLIDDANRVDYFKQIVDYHKKVEQCQLKLLITVRDYAKDEICSILPSGESKCFQVGRMSDDDILEIVKKSLGITNQRYLDAINNIAKGSPRLALMAGKLAVNNQNIGSLSNLAQLFSEYYKPIFERMRIKGEENLLKGLAILSVLSPVKQNDEFVLELCKVFELSLSEFDKAIKMLANLEVVNKYSNGYIKIAEQNFGFFIFYFEILHKEGPFLDRILSIGYKANSPHLKECIVSVANLFGLEELKGCITGVLSSFLKKISEDKDKISFLKDYWILIQDDTIAFIASIVLNDAKYNKDGITYEVNFDTNQFAFDYSRDKLLDLIADSFNYNINNLGNMLQLALEYVSNRPNLAPQLSWHIANSFGFTVEDINCGLFRHLEFLSFIDNRLSQNDILAQQLFWKHISLFLKSDHSYTRSTYHRNEIRICNLSIGDYKSVTHLHKTIWEMVERHFDACHFRELICTIPLYGNKGSKLPSLDTKAICSIIEKYASPLQFNDCWMVDKFARHAKHITSVHHKLELMRSKYHNKQFDFYTTINWNYLNGRYKEGFDYKAHYTKKNKELQQKFLFNSIRATSYFFKKFLVLFSSPLVNKNNLVPSLCDIICINLKSNFRIGAHLLSLALKSKIEGMNFYPILNTILESDDESKFEHILAIKKIVLRKTYLISFDYILKFYEIIPFEYLQIKDCNIFLDELNKVGSRTRIYINPSLLLKMEALRKGWLDSLFELIHKKNTGECNISINCSEDIQWIDLLQTYELKEKTYLQQLIKTEYFDYERILLHKLLLDCPSLLIKFAKIAKAAHEDKLSNIIWSVPNIEEQIRYILNRVDRWALSTERFPLEWEYVFFNSNIDEKYNRRIVALIRGFYIDSSDKEQALRIAKQYSDSLYEEFVLNYLESASEDEFMNIDWTGASHGITFVNTTYGEVLKVRWIALLKIVNKSQSLKRFPIIAKINQCIRRAEESTKEDKERDNIFDRR